MDWNTTGHTGVDVPLTAIGPGGVVLTGLSPPVMLALLRGAGIVSGLIFSRLRILRRP